MRWTLVKVAVSAALIWLLVRDRDPGGLARALLAAKYDAFLAAAGLLCLLCVASALRWAAVLKALDRPVGIRLTLPLVMIGHFFSQTLPSTVGGDAVRMWELTRADVPAATAISSVMIDRAVGFFGLCLMLTAMLPMLFKLVPDPAVHATVMTLLAGGYFGIAAAVQGARIPLRLRRFRFVAAMVGISSDLARTLLVPRAALPAVSFGILVHIGNAIVVLILARGLGLPVDAISCLLIVPLANLVAVVPVSIGGWGVREGAFMVGFAFVGLSGADAFVLSVLFGLANVAVGLAGGVVWLARREATPGEIIDASEQAVTRDPR